MVLTVTLPCARVRKVYIGVEGCHRKVKNAFSVFCLSGFVYICKKPRKIWKQFKLSWRNSVAKEWNLPPDEVYRRMKRVNLIEGYILKHYEAIHAESRENITEDIAGCLLQWEKAEKQEEPV